MSAPRVTIFIQIYNTERFVKRAIESALALKGGYEIEVIAIDDASKDRSWEVVSSIQDPRLKAIRHEKNTGACATANEGYQLARGEFVARLDSDDVYRPDFLAQLVPLLEANPKVGLAYGDIAMIDPEDKITSPGKNVERAGRPLIGDEFFAACEKNFIPPPATLMRREALAALMPVPPEYHFLDWYLSTGIAERWQTAFCDEVLAEYRIHETNMHRTMVADRTGEKISFMVLDRLWANGFRADEKSTQRNRVYGMNYLTYAEKYFGIGAFADARRCYKKAFGCTLGFAFKRGVFRRFLATWLNPERYAKLKGRPAPKTPA